MSRRAWLWILLVAALAALGGWRLRRGPAIQTDLLAMLPDTEKNPVAEQALRALAQSSGTRAVVLVGHADEGAARAAALACADSLERSGVFTHVLCRIPPIDPTQVARFYGPYRFRLPGVPAADADLGELVQARLASPQGTVGGLGPARDPLGELDGFLGALPLSALRLELSGDQLVARAPDATFVLVTADLPGSAFDPDVQTRTLAAVRAAERQASAGRPGLTFLHTGAVFYAEEARTGAEREMNLISLGSIVAILLLYLLVFRTLRHLLLGMACVAAGMIVATVLCLLIYGQLYLLTLVCGASVLGVAVDYSFLYFAHHQGDGPAWNAREALRRILPALTLGFLTTLMGYSALALAPFPGLRQIAVFTVLGLAGAFLTVVLALPDALKAPTAERPGLTRALVGLERRTHRLANHRRVVPWALGLLVLLGLAAWPIRVRDDANALIQPSPALAAQEARIRTLTGLSNNGTFFLVEGASEGEALAREEALRDCLAPLVDAGELDSLQGVSCFVPSPQRQAAALARNRELAPRLLASLRGLGFRPEVLAALQADLAASGGRPLAVADWLREPFSTPYRSLWMGPTPQGYATVLAPLGSPVRAHMLSAAAEVPGVQYVDKAASVGALLGRYRRLATAALVGACLLVWGALALRYGPRSAFWVVLPAGFGILLPLAASALLGLPLSLFGVMGLILTLGFAVDYTVFLREGDHHHAASLLGVLLASGSTLISYGLLAVSRTPILRGFGLIISLGVVGSVLTSFLALRGRNPEQP